MQTITTVGLDIAKSVFQVHCVDAAGQVVIRRQLKRRYVLMSAAGRRRHKSSAVPFVRGVGGKLRHVPSRLAWLHAARGNTASQAIRSNGHAIGCAARLPICWHGGFLKPPFLVFPDAPPSREIWGLRWRIAR